MSHIEYVDRIKWLYEHRELIGGLTFDYEPDVLRFFLGTLKPKNSNWDEALALEFKSISNRSIIK